MPSFSARFDSSHPYQSLSSTEDDGMMENFIPTTATHHSKTTTMPPLVPSDGSLLDYFDLPSPPSTPLRSNYYSLSHSAFSSFSSPTYTLGLVTPSASRASNHSRSSSVSSTCSDSPPTSITSSPPRWPTPSQRIPRLLPTPPRSRSASSASSTTSSPPPSPTTDATPPSPTTEHTRTLNSSEEGPTVARARHTPYYPPNASRNVDHKRIYMNRGPHYIANWTPLGSLPRGVQAKIESGMCRFVAD